MGPGPAHLPPFHTHPFHMAPYWGTGSAGPFHPPFGPGPVIGGF